MQDPLSHSANWSPIYVALAVVTFGTLIVTFLRRSFALEDPSLRWARHDSLCRVMDRL